MLTRGWFESSGWITDWSDLELSSEEAPLYSPTAENPSRLHHSHHILSYSFTLSTSRSRSNHQHADHHCGAPFSSQNQTHYNCWSNVISIGNIFLPLAFLKHWQFILINFKCTSSLYLLLLLRSTLSSLWLHQSHWMRCNRSHHILSAMSSPMSSQSLSPMSSLSLSPPFTWLWLSRHWPARKLFSWDNIKVLL